MAYFSPSASGLRISGTTTGLQDGSPFVASYEIDVDSEWRTRRAWVVARTPAGETDRLILADGVGHWLVDSLPAPQLLGCIDIDLEVSALTNALPVHRLALSVGEGANTTGAYCRVDGNVERLDQSYLRVADAGTGFQFDYEAPAFAFRCRLIFDRAGLVVDYPGIAARAA